ncbi:hypothetical protein [Planctomycetes bacterium CA13]
MNSYRKWLPAICVVLLGLAFGIAKQSRETKASESTRVDASQTRVDTSQTRGVNTIESLRDAIVFLKDTFGTQYPSGTDYLKRLESISDATSESYDQLQREALLSHPHIKGHDWLIEVRDQYWGNHGPINTMFQNGDIHRAAGSGGIQSWHSLGGRLDVISIEDSGVVTRKQVLAEEPDGIFRDADVSFDGQKILFSMRRNKADDYHLYEVDVDGRNLKQLTFGSMISDVDPIYLPDGKILFSSTRDPKYCQCNRHISLNLFTMESDGANIVQVSKNDLADFHASLRPDGTVLYSRWEYVDRQFGPSLGLWTSNPDGTRHQLFMGNNAWSPGAMLDARTIPGTDSVVCVYGATHDLPWGAMAVVDRSKGMDGLEPIIEMWPESGRKLVTPSDDAINRSMKFRGSIDNFKKLPTRYEDPYPVHDLEAGTGGGQFFLVSKRVGKRENRSSKMNGKMAIMLADIFGNEIVVYETGDEVLGAYGAVPLAARKRAPAIPDAVDYTMDHGFLYVNDVYIGDRDEMTNVSRGSIKYLRIIEAPPRQTYDERGYWNTDAQQVGAMNWNLTNNKRILGDVPVEEDGSAYFELPADTFVQIHALDENKQMIQAMRSATIVRPGETQGCIGCHENRVSTPMPNNALPMAMRRPTSRLEPWLDTPSVEEAKPFNYLTDVQPVFDRHCVACHDYDQEAGKELNLCGDLSYPFNVSYTELMSKSGQRYEGSEEKMVNFVGDGPPGVLPAYAWGSHRSKLVRVLKEGHYDVKLSDKEMQRITSWIDINAVYYGRYESYYPGRSPLLALEDGARKRELVYGKYTKRGSLLPYLLENGHLVNFTRPEKSPALALMEDDQHRALALSYLKDAGALLKKRPREDQSNEGIAESEMDLHNSERLKTTQRENAKAVKALIKNKKYYQFK